MRERGREKERERERERGSKVAERRERGIDIPILKTTERPFMNV